MKECFRIGRRITQWHATWITPETITEPDVRKGAGYLRKTFFIPEESLAKEALLFATAHGLYDLRLNGHRVTKARFTPGCDEYGMRLQYQCYDIGTLLQAGENELSVVLGDGWYRGCNGIDGVRNLFGEDLSFLAEIQIDEECILKTDRTFMASEDGPIRLADMELGEIYDAGKEQPVNWHPAREMAFGTDALVPSETEMVCAQECFSGHYLKTPAGEIVFDFGQNMAGYTTIDIENAKKGSQIVVIHGETLDADGNFTNRNFQPGERNRSGGIRQEVRYICKDGTNHYEPLFSVFGFRYAKVLTDIPVKDLRLHAVAVYTRMRERAGFVCGNGAVNRLFQNCVWSMKSNFLDIPTDCPTRERAGWTGDAGVFVRTGLRLMDCEGVYRKWLSNLRLMQYPDGKLPYICPRNGKPGAISDMFSASVGWGDAAVIVPWEIYCFTGDKRVLEENYDMIRRWVRFLETRAKQENPKRRVNNPLYREYLIETGMDYGECNEPGSCLAETMKEAFENGQPEVATAYLAYSSGLAAKIAGILYDPKEEAYFSRLHENAVKAYRSEFLPEGQIQSGRQCEYVRPIAMGLLSAEEEIRAAADLNERIAENGYHLNTGFLSTAHLLPVLTDHGYGKTAGRLLLQEEYPSWLYTVKRGATTIWETWGGIGDDGLQECSLNHYAYGAVAGYMITGLLGIRWDYPVLRICPCLIPQLGFAQGFLDIPQGRVSVSWCLSSGNGVCRYEIGIPEGTTAHLFLPGEDEQLLTHGMHVFERCIDDQERIEDE